MSNSSRRLSRGDRRRNDRLAALCAVVTRHSAVLAFDLAADKQVCALTDQDSRVAAAVRRELPRHGATRWHSKIVRAVFDAAADPARAAAGVSNQRAGALERTRFALADLAHARAETALVETRMVEVLDELGLTTLVTSIPGLSAVGAAAILAETGDPPDSPPPGRWSNTPGSAPATTPRAPTRARPESAAAAAPSSAWQRGGRCGPHCATTPCSPPGTRT